MSRDLYERIADWDAVQSHTSGGAPPSMWSHYEVLGLTEQATTEEVKKAYKKLALRFHPDKADPERRERSEAVFRAVACAYETLVDPERRLRYDSGDGMSFEDSIGSPFEIFARTFFETRQKTDSDTRSGDWTLHNLSNYEVRSAEEPPEHMQAIVHTGLGYLAKVLNLERHTVVLLQHRRIDILWVILAFEAGKELNQERFQEDGYPITYYDNPLQPGILPRWSDQNVLGGSRIRDPELQAAKDLSLEDYIERKELARLEFEALEREQRRALCGG